MIRYKKLMASSARFLRSARLVHLYLGVFTAPALLFFAFTGAVQTFGLHETQRGSSYQPPKVLVELGQLHKKQTLVLQQRRPPEPNARPKDATSAEALTKSPKPDQTNPQPKPKNLIPMKIFFLIVSLGLLLSTITGVYMAYKYARGPRLITALWLAGIVIPALLAFL